MMKMNKRGDVTVTILVIGILFVCLLALLTFFLSSIRTADDFVDIGLIEKAVLRSEQGDFMAGQNFIFEEKLVREHWYSLTKTKQVFSVKYSP